MRDVLHDVRPTCSLCEGDLYAFWLVVQVCHPQIVVAIATRLHRVKGQDRDRLVPVLQRNKQGSLVSVKATPCDHV